MKIRNQHLAAVLLLAGMATAGCSQQQAAEPVIESVPEPAPVVEYAPPPQVIEPEPIVVMPPEPAPVVRPAPVRRPVVKQRPPVRQYYPQPRPPVVRPAIKVPSVKAKGNYRGAVPIDRQSLQQYQY